MGKSYDEKSPRTAINKKFESHLTSLYISGSSSNSDEIMSHSWKRTNEELDKIRNEQLDGLFVGLASQHCSINSLYFEGVPES
ncbi:hypothetical protein RhiirA4_472813 [Rhizophagus irregularis]|uniref:Uncharacterized protein n=1 Tax=Rhizophagus irregularis TaxID=588596 RepID=A0A2I1H5R0_9GLOM|nr:hypothetical protein RhiirA4_472813 [Rhizophagus irregularis]